MIIRSLVACTFMTASMLAGGASAQVLLCPDVPPADVAARDAPAEAEQLLTRLVVALDLHGHRGIDESKILEAHAETPSALLAKLTNVADRCAVASDDVRLFHDALPGLRQDFLEATGMPATSDDGRDPRIETVALDQTGAERLEQSIDLSVRELWRKLWFRSAGAGEREGDRWAVIVSSPADADSGWDQLGRHQKRWKDAYFELHEPYYDSNPHHAIVVGRRLSEKQAGRLLDYVIELGMAEDSFLWRLPDGQETKSTEAVVDKSDAKSGDALDISVLER